MGPPHSSLTQLPLVALPKQSPAVERLDQAASLLKGGLKLRWVRAHVKRTPGQAGPDGYRTFDYNDSADILAKSAGKGEEGSIVDHGSLPAGDRLKLPKR